MIFANKFKAGHKLHPLKKKKKRSSLPKRTKGRPMFAPKSQKGNFLKGLCLVKLGIQYFKQRISYWHSNRVIVV